MMKLTVTWLKTLLLLTVLAVYFSGCITKALWRDNDVNVYDETIIAFYASSDVDKIIFIGNKFHYIFSVGTSELQEVLEAREFLGLNQKNLRVTTVINRENLSVFRSGIGIEFNVNELNIKQEEWLKLHGFRTAKFANQRSGFRPVLRKGLSLEGKRYKANNEVNSRVVKLDYPIHLEISEPVNNKIYKVLATPVTLTADAGLLLLKAVFYYPIIWTMKPKVETQLEGN